MTDNLTTYTAFADQRMIASGPLDHLLPQLKKWSDRDGNALPLVFEDQTGRQVDFDLSGTTEQVLSRVLLPAALPRTRPGRPRLGVVAREISLLPRHWEWLEQQPNGASAAIRRLVEEARKQEPAKQLARRGAEATGRFLTAMAGNLPGYEEASRALYDGNRNRFEDLIRNWPTDIRVHAWAMARKAFTGE